MENTPAQLQPDPNPTLEAAPVETRVVGGRLFTVTEIPAVDPAIVRARDGITADPIGTRPIQERHSSPSVPIRTAPILGRRNAE